jgi:hypothetical protein
MTPLAKKVKALFGKPELAAEAPAATVRESDEGGTEPHLSEEKAAPVTVLTHPHISPRGELVIPFSADPKYHYWKPGGQSIAKTLAELDAPPEVWRRYVGIYTETRQ